MWIINRKKKNLVLYLIFFKYLCLFVSNLSWSYFFSLLFYWVVLLVWYLKLFTFYTKLCLVTWCDLFVIHFYHTNENKLSCKQWYSFHIGWDSWCETDISCVLDCVCTCRKKKVPLNTYITTTTTSKHKSTHY